MSLSSSYDFIRQHGISRTTELKRIVCRAWFNVPFLRLALAIQNLRWVESIELRREARVVVTFRSGIASNLPSFILFDVVAI